METPTLSAAQKEALRGLLDDPSPRVRRALLAHFLQLGAGAGSFLQEISRGPHRILARHASWFLEELKFADPIAEFRGFIRSLNYELETGALLLARTVSPLLDAGTCCGTLDAIAQRCRELTVEPTSTREKCRIVNRVLFHEWGFHGDGENNHDPQHSFLDQVLRRRAGTPLSLSIVYLLVAERLGLELEPVSLPGDFVVGCYTDRQPFFIDPFERGVFRSADEMFAQLRSHQIAPKATDLAPTTIREVLCGSCRHLAQHYQTHGDPGRALLFAGFVEEFDATYARHAQP